MSAAIRKRLLQAEQRVDPPMPALPPSMLDDNRRVVEIMRARPNLNAREAVLAMFEERY